MNYDVKKIFIRINSIYFQKMSSNSCSFCGENSHNIRQCNNTLISIYFNRIKMIYMDLLSVRMDNEERKVRFTNRLRQQFNVRELRAVAVQYTGELASRIKAVFIEKIWSYCNANIQILDNSNQWISVNHTSSPAQVSGEEPLLWVIDRTPNRVTIIETHNFLPVTNFFMERVRQYDELYQPAADEFLAFGPLEPINLLAELSAQVKKFNIVPLIIATETPAQLNEEIECAICLEQAKLVDSVILNCHHKFCGECILKSLALCRKDVPTCALCRQAIDICIVKNHELYNEVAEYCKFD